MNGYTANPVNYIDPLGLITSSDAKKLGKILRGAGQGPENDDTEVARHSVMGTYGAHKEEAEEASVRGRWVTGYFYSLAPYRNERQGLKRGKLLNCCDIPAVDELEEAVCSDEPTLVAIMAANNERGTLCDTKRSRRSNSAKM